MEDNVLIRHRGHEPVVHESAYVAPTAALVGRVVVGGRARVMYGAVVDAEGSRVEIGECAVICENAVLRGTAKGDTERPVLLGDHAFVGPHATLLGCTVGRCCYVATGATVLHGARLAAGAVAAVGALVHAGTVVPSEFFVPPNTVAVGDPLRVFGSDEQEAMAEAIRGVRFAKAAFGIDMEWEDRIARYERVAEVRSTEFGAHANDHVLPNGA
jgi:carbonic anhydrase/acetyltransferase-like protein (isoleucine patch superfamily)